jgi:hypothetical protein
MIKTIKAEEPKKGIDWRIVVSGILAITIIECFALCNGIDGIVLTTVVGIIALAIGVTIPNPIKS